MPPVGAASRTDALYESILRDSQRVIREPLGLVRRAGAATCPSAAEAALSLPRDLPVRADAPHGCALPAVLRGLALQRVGHAPRKTESVFGM